MSGWLGVPDGKKTPPLKVQLQRGWSPSLRERVELKVGWPTVKVPFVMVWGFKCSFLFFLFGNGGGLKTERVLLIYKCNKVSKKNTPPLKTKQ